MISGYHVDTNNIDGMLAVGDEDDNEATMKVLMPENLNILTLPSKKKRGTNSLLF